MILNLPYLDPNALELGPIVIRWYSLAYIAGILFTLFWLKKCNEESKIMSQKAYDDWLLWAVLSIIIGGRLGYVLFYNLPYFLQNPLEIAAIWHGGMSFHGGLCGSIVGLWLFCKKYKIEFLKLADVIAVATPVGIFFGRIANFINMELYGRATAGNFGIIFPNAGNFPRHPSQLYEAFSEGFLTFLILIFLYKFSKIRGQKGVLSAIFLICYGFSRIIVENFREPDEQIGFLFAKITLGQLLSLPLILSGIFIIIFSFKKKN